MNYERAARYMTIVRSVKHVAAINFILNFPVLTTVQITVIRAHFSSPVRASCTNACLWVVLDPLAYQNERESAMALNISKSMN